MSEKLETKNLMVDYSGTLYPYTVTPVKDTETGKTTFEIELIGAKSVMKYTSFNWEQVSGTPIYRDLLVNMGMNIQKNYPDLF